MQSRPALDYEVIGPLSDIVIAFVLAAFLLRATDSTGDIVPRPLVIAVLYAVPGIVGLIGAAVGRAWLVLAGALPLIPGAWLALSGVTLVFLLPAALMLIAAARMARRPRTRSATFATGIAVFAITVLIIAAGWATLIGMTVSGCHPIAGGQECGDGYISLTGLTVGGAFLAAAVAIAAIGAGLPRLRRWQS